MAFTPILLNAKPDRSCSSDYVVCLLLREEITLAITHLDKDLIIMQSSRDGISYEVILAIDKVGD